MQTIYTLKQNMPKKKKKLNIASKIVVLPPVTFLHYVKRLFSLYVSQMAINAANK